MHMMQETKMISVGLLLVLFFNGCWSEDSTPLNPFDVPATKELFRCAGQVCPPGQDCISVGGTPRCADPCKHYSVLNDTWRANDHFEDLSDPHCDDEVNWQGWYRMYLGDVSVRMPERCQPIKVCGTHAPSFLVQPHPQVGDGVQKHTICGTWENGCCKFHLNPIHVKACAGSYVVYKLVNPQDCRVAYCADVNTKVCATCGENEACVSDDKIIYRCEKRAGKSVPEAADDGTPLNPFDVPATKVLFRCNGQVCPPGQDCINVDGTTRCADPCLHFSVLNDTWRANDHFEDLSDPHCDDEVDWQGWYRMYLGDISVRMPERCQPIKMCGTHAPSFLVQPHPQVGDGVQKHTICGTWENGCCKFHLNPIHVKACAGNYVVYKLVNPHDCRVAYCADVNTKVCATCAESEACVSDDKITYRCEKRAGKTISAPIADGTPLNPFDVPATKVLFRCNGQVCPLGQDCINVGGAPRCADPCRHFSVLNDSWRANDHFEDLSDPHCDDEVDWQGWYRMYLGDVSVRMPERCQPIKMCGTHAPSFLVQPHPQVGDGVQEHTICGTWENGCCKFHLNPIHVKACAGNYVVYKLVNPQDCRVAYCADVNTKVCATCGEGESCVSDDKITYRCEKRAGKIASEATDDGTPLNPFDVPATKELFRCNGQVCPPGQDCITVDGTPRCADPCQHFSVLNDTWRANDHFEDLSDPHCDDEVDWQGWYRMYLGDVSVRMPERCQPIKMCGTHAPSFLVQPHPQVGDGVQKHTICGTWENGCCKFHLNPIHVKACAGNYVVYKLVNPHDCRVAYCADVNTKVCATCAESEACVSDDKITYRCEKRAGKTVSAPIADGTPLNPFDVPATKVLFRCNGQVCPLGQDCINVDGTPRCADPCRHFSVLNDSWRANDHFEDLSDPHCDDEVDWQGWYRMYLGDVSVRMPERCQPIKMCGTHAPSFLVQPHPQVGDGVQKHTICGTWENGCCKFHLNPIHVKACPGNYVVYKLVNPQDCRVAYCADVNTKVCVTCREGESCVSDNKITYRCEKRAGKIAPEAADDGTPLNPFDVPATKELFRCNGQVCPPGQDCITVDGTPRCADPCQHFSVLNDTWRANDHFEDLSDPHCDDEVDWQGWYRMYLGDVSVRMPERCQPIKMCGTHAPSFLVQPHPQVGDGVQKHTICGTWENGCCKFHLKPIHVKACAGNYVVYKLVNPHDCRVAYCADVNTKVCATCAESEVCVSDDKITYRCEKRAGKTISAPVTDGTPLNPFDVPATKELFRCAGQVCPPGQDCISVGGAPRCADPCLHFSVLNDTWRANDHFEDLSDPHCDDDVDWQGWYRMYLGDVSVRMPERCQPIKMCGTHAPSFLVQPHPQVGDGVQKHTICGTWENGCCKFHLNPIHVKACAGNYVVYKLVNPQDCRVAYCADVNTKVCATCGEDETCVSDDKISYRCEKRAGKIAPEPADDGTPMNPFDVPATKVLFRCNGQVCPPGQDCITVDGTPRCADPCQHFSVLNDSWRANDHFEDLSDPHCDDEVDWQGWYRMYLGDVSVRMPERCQPIKMCGTHAPSFLVQPHPQVGDGVQKHTICGTWENGCCKFHLNPIHVKACAGNYVVYKLVNPQDCRVAYCADVNTKVCATCGDNETCVSDNKINYRCEK